MNVDKHKETIFINLVSTNWLGEQSFRFNKLNLQVVTVILESLMLNQAVNLRLQKDSCLALSQNVHEVRVLTRNYFIDNIKLANLLFH